MRGILMSGGNGLAVYEGRKTQTRRVIVPQQENVARCPYGKVGDRLYIREAGWMWGHWKKNGTTKTGRQKWIFEVQERCRSVVGPAVLFTRPDHVIKRDGVGEGWVYRHARFMPRWAARSIVELTDVRVERVQDISEADAIAEGMIRASDLNNEYHGWHYSERWVSISVQSQTAKDAFSRLWDSINAARGYGWAVNPFVWALTFRRVEDGQ